MLYHCRKLQTLWTSWCNVCQLSTVVGNQKMICSSKNMTKLQAVAADTLPAPWISYKNWWLTTRTYSMCWILALVRRHQTSTFQSAHQVWWVITGPLKDAMSPYWSREQTCQGIYLYGMPHSIPIWVACNVGHSLGFPHMASLIFVIGSQQITHNLYLDYSHHPGWSTHTLYMPVFAIPSGPYIVILLLLYVDVDTRWKG